MEWGSYRVRSEPERVHEYVDEFREADDAGVRLALAGLAVFLGGHVVVILGRDDAGHQWLVPNPGCPNREVRELMEQDWAPTLRRMEAWRPDHDAGDRQNGA